MLFSASKKTAKKRSVSLITVSLLESGSGSGSGSGLPSAQRERSYSGLSPERRESATESMINLSKAIGGGVGGLAQEGKYNIEYVGDVRSMRNKDCKQNCSRKMMMSICQIIYFLYCFCQVSKQHR